MSRRDHRPSRRRSPGLPGLAGRSSCGRASLLGATLLVVVVVVVGGALAAAAVPASAAGIRSAGRLPLVAAAGGQLEVTLRGAPASAGLVLAQSAASKTAKRGLVLRGRGTRAHGRLRVRASIPTSIPQGAQLTLFACRSAKAGVRSGKGCSALGKVPTSGPALQQRLDAAVAAHRISKGQAALYGLYALSKDRRLPLELRAKVAGPSGAEGLIHDAAAHAGSLPRALRRQLVWYFVPPTAKGSAWHRAAPAPGYRLQASAASRSRGASCQGYESLAESPYSGQYHLPWIGVPTTDGHTIVWYQPDEPRAQAAARAYARYMPEIWSKLTRELHAPKSDAGERCFHGPDGRFDIYVNDLITLLAAGGQAHGSAIDVKAITMPYPLAHSAWCTDRPAWISINPGQSRFVLAHEFMHAIEFSYRYASCDDVAWWDEGVANWAADFVYPNDNDERERWPQWVTDPLAQHPIADGDYDTWPFWMMLQRTLGTGVLRQIFAKLGGAKSVAAVNAAIPGGYRRQWSRFAAHVYNQPPIGTLGFELNQSFKAWDGWDATPKLPGAQTLELGAGGGEHTIGLPSQNPVLARLTIDAYHRVTIPDKLVREVRFKNGAGSNAGILAMLKLGDGSWKLKDWTGKSEVTLCRDKPDEDVRELVIVTANVSQSAPLPAFTHELRGRPVCTLPTYSGTFSGTGYYGPEDVGDGSVSASWSGNVTFRPPTEEDLRSSFPGLFPYRIAGGHVSYGISGHFGDCDVNGSTTFDLPTLDTSGPGTLTVYPGDPQLYFIYVGMPLSQSFMATRSNCSDSSQNGPFLWLLSLGVPTMIGTGDIAQRTAPTGIPYAGPPTLPIPPSGSLAGSASMVGTTSFPIDSTWHWSLAPSG